MDKTVIFENDEAFYLVAPVAPFEPAQAEVDELAFAGDLQKMAPNEHIGWLRGQYVESEKPNQNGALWSAQELEIAALTPMLMPVTVMHDPRTAVGMIADTKLLTREADESVQRSRIDTTLGVWKHRFPDVWEEVAENYKAGSLMQSMECRNAYYDCGECGARFPKLPGGAERSRWCEHLRAGETAAANDRPVRRLGNVTFTGTGLIFGTRGAKGAYDEANLEVIKEEVAEFHERARSPQTKPRRQSKVETTEIARSEYDALKKDADRVTELESKLSTAEETAAKVPELEQKLEAEETAKKTAETERDELKKKVEETEETARKATLSADRRGKLGKGFLAKLGDFTKSRLEEQAANLSDEEWDNRLKELEETADVKRDDGEPAGKQEETGGETFTEEETARSGAGDTGQGSNGGSGTEASPARRSAVVGGLFGNGKTS